MNQGNDGLTRLELVDELNPNQNFSDRKRCRSHGSESITEPGRKLDDHLNQFLGVAVELCLNNLIYILALRKSRDPDLSKSVSQGRREFFLSKVTTGVHSGKELETVGSNNERVVDSLLSQEKRPGRFEHGVQTFQN
ncbi:hypothetical protein HG530_003261 [Fusarium avenaceum]|nr:hypothetical protein HG530_003261 [Fusarium avenaceum]